MKYQSLNVLNKSNLLTEDAVTQVAAMLNNSGANRKQRRKLEKALTKTQSIVEHAQRRVDRSSFKEYQNNLDVMMLRFFSVLGIVLKTKYNFEETEDNEQITEMFETLNSCLEEYRNLSAEEVAKICYDSTGIELQATH